MKIAQVCPFYTPAIGGVKQVVEELSERYVKQGHEVHVFTSDWDKEKRIKQKETTINGVIVHRCFYWFKAVNFISFWPSVAWKIFKGDFDVVHTHLGFHPHSFFTALVCKLKKIPHVHTTHCPWTEENRNFLGRLIKSVAKLTYTRWTHKLSDKIIAITPWEVDFIEDYGGDKDKIIVLPNGMDEIFFKKIKDNYFKKKLGINNKVILFFGRYSVTKSPQDFVKIAKSVLKEKKNLDFVMIGPDEGEFKETKKLAQNEKRIHVLGPIRGKDKIAWMYQSAEIYILPSFREGLPLTLFEAMAAGLPIIATPVNGIPYEMEDNVNGFLIKHGDIEVFKKAVIKILEDKKLAKKFSSNNLKKSKNYSWDIIANKTILIYKKLVK